MRDRPSPLIDFVVAGVQKSGTRALQHFFSQHPEIGLVSPPKIAPHYFDVDEYFDGSRSSADEYHSWFSREALSKTTGDITPIYSYWEPSIERMFEYNPDLRVIMMLRNPVDRAYSHWSMVNHREGESDPFVRAIVKERIRGRRPGQQRVHSFLDRGFYGPQLARLFKYFPREQCLILRSEGLRNDHKETLQRIFGFIGVACDPVPEPQVVHEGTYRPMPRAVRKALQLYYRRDVRRVERLLGWSLEDWIDQRPN